MSESVTESDALTMLQWNFETWQHLTEVEFTATFHRSALKRAGFAKLTENIKLLTPKIVL